MKTSLMFKTIDFIQLQSNYWNDLVEKENHFYSDFKLLMTQIVLHETWYKVNILYIDEKYNITHFHIRSC